MKFSKYLVELELRKKLERKGYAVMKISRTCNLLIGNRKEIFVVLVKKSRGRHVTVPQSKIKALIDLGEKFFAIPLIAVKFFRKGWVIKEVSVPEKIRISVDEESDIDLI